jgi:hypothetical protein
MKLLILTTLFFGINLYSPQPKIKVNNTLKINLQDSDVIKATILEFVNCEFFTNEGFEIDRFTVGLSCSNGLTYFAVVENNKFHDKIVSCIKSQKKGAIIIIKNINVKNLKTNEIDFVPGNVILEIIE